ncbi:unnamed protein product, partial [Mesorhabditis spiculigera]
MFPDYWYKFNYTLNDGTTIDFVMIDTIILCACCYSFFAGNTADVEYGSVWDLLLKGNKVPDGPKNASVAEKQWEWIAQTLNQSRADYLFVGGHYPVYSMSSHGPTQCLVERLKPLLERFHVSAYFAGHDHTLQHIQTDLPDGASINYIISGAASRTDRSNKHKDYIPAGSLKFNYPTGWNPISQLGFSRGAFIYTEINAQRAHFEFKKGDGETKYVHDIPPRSAKTKTVTVPRQEVPSKMIEFVVVSVFGGNNVASDSATVLIPPASIGVIVVIAKSRSSSSSKSSAVSSALRIELPAKRKGTVRGTVASTVLLEDVVVDIELLGVVVGVVVPVLPDTVLLEDVGAIEAAVLSDTVLLEVDVVVFAGLLGDIVANAVVLEMIGGVVTVLLGEVGVMIVVLTDSEPLEDVGVVGAVLLRKKGTLVLNTSTASSGTGTVTAGSGVSISAAVVSETSGIAEPLVVEGTVPGRMTALGGLSSPAAMACGPATNWGTLGGTVGAFSAPTSSRRSALMAFEGPAANWGPVEGAVAEFSAPTSSRRSALMAFEGPGANWGTVGATVTPLLVVWLPKMGRVTRKPMMVRPPRPRVTVSGDGDGGWVVPTMIDN